MAGCDHFRAYSRQGVDLQAVARCPDAGWQGDVTVRDLGIGGACVLTADFLAPGLAVDLEIQAPTLWDPLLLRATVTWCSAADGGWHAGMRFDHAEPSALMALFELLGVLAPRPGAPALVPHAPKA
jgi:hypothetical protein